MENALDPKKFPSSDWEWLEQNGLWDRHQAAAWHLPLLDTERALALIKTTKQLSLTPVNGKSEADLKGHNLIHLRGFGALRKLALPRGVEDADLAFIGQLGKLATLYLTHDRYTLAGFRHLSALTNLKEFSADWLPPGGEAIQLLAALPKLSSLGLNQTAVTDQDLIPLKDTVLKSLNIGGRQVTGESMQYIGQITTLQELMLGSYTYTQQITDESLKSLAGLTKLTRLTLYGTAITAQGLAHLEPLSSLKKLRLDKGLCGTPEAKALKRKIPGLAIGDDT